MLGNPYLLRLSGLSVHPTQFLKFQCILFIFEAEKFKKYSNVYKKWPKLSELSSLKFLCVSTSPCHRAARPDPTQPENLRPGRAGPELVIGLGSGLSFDPTGRVGSGLQKKRISVVVGPGRSDQVELSRARVRFLQSNGWTEPGPGMSFQGQAFLGQL